MVSLPRFHRVVFGAAVLVYLITAWNSTGYHSADEHFQIIAFAQWKLGELPAAHLAWEFNAGIRSSLQPWIAVGMFKCAGLVGVEDPFLRTFLLRLITALLALFAMHRFVEVTRRTYDDRQQRGYIVLAYGLWFLPFLAVRFSSEGWSAILLLHALTSVLSSERMRYRAIHAGLFTGIAMLCRPQTGLIVLALIGWMLVIRREALKPTGALLGASALILLCGLVLDNAFYGGFTPTTWNYVKLGFVGDPSIRFDELPWYYYPPWIVKYAIPPIGTAILLAFMVLLWKRPSHPIVWCALPYLIAHSSIAHKELRFLYPLAMLVPWLLMEAWNVIQGTPRMVRLGMATNVALVVLAVFNLTGLALVMTSPAGEGRVRLAEVLHREARPGDRIGYVVDPAIAWRIELPAFYTPDATTEVIIDPQADMLEANEPAFLVLQDGVRVPPMAPNSTLVPIARTTTAWEETLMRWYTWDEGQKPWTLYRMNRNSR